MQKMRLLSIVYPKILAARQQRMCTCVCQFSGALHRDLFSYLRVSILALSSGPPMYLIGVFKFLKFASEMSLTDVANRTSAALQELNPPLSNLNQLLIMPPRKHKHSAKSTEVGGLLGACISTGGRAAPAPAALATPARTPCQCPRAAAHDEPPPQKMQHRRRNTVNAELMSWSEYDSEEVQTYKSKCNRLEDELGKARLQSVNEYRRYEVVLRPKDQEINTLARRNNELCKENDEKQVLIEENEIIISNLQQQLHRQSWMNKLEQLQQQAVRDQSGQRLTLPIIVIDEDERRAAINAPPQMDQSAKRKRATGPANAAQLISPEKASRKAGDGLMGSKANTSAITIRRSTRRRQRIPVYIDNESDRDNSRRKRVNRKRRLQPQAGKRAR